MQPPPIPPNPPPTDPHASIDVVVEQEIQILARLHQTLKREEAALRRLDYSEIDNVTEEKEEAQQALVALQTRRASTPGTICDDLRQRYRQLASDVRTLGGRNNKRLEVCAATVRELLAALTGNAGNATYGRSGPRSTPDGARPVLTSTVG
ncbi:MAG: hypothetical protein V3V08_13730 [Nannocystaceae bacterium]